MKFLEPVIVWMCDQILRHKPKLNKEKLETYFFSFWAVHQNFEVIAVLNYRFRRNLHVHGFSAYKTAIMALSNDFTMWCHTGTGRCSKKVCVAFSLVHISFSKNFVYLAYAEFKIFNHFIFFWKRSPGISKHLCN